MSSRVFAVEIELADAASPETADATIGLYNSSQMIPSAISAGATSLLMYYDIRDSVCIGERFILSEGATSEWCTVIGLNYGDTPNCTTVYVASAIANNYTTAATAIFNSKFRVIQNAVTGVTGWAAGLLVDRGIGSWTRGTDLPGVSCEGDCTVTLTNTVRLQYELHTRGITLIGAPLRVYEFVDTARRLRWSGVCEPPTWDAQQYVIHALTPQNKRRANILTRITESAYPNSGDSDRDKCIPASFGKLTPRYTGVFGHFVKYIAGTYTQETQIYDREHALARFVRIADSEVPFNNSQIAPGRAEPQGISTFPVANPGRPVLASDITTWFQVRLAGEYDTAGVVPPFTNWYLKGISGAGANEYRRIDHMDQDLWSVHPVVHIRVADYFAEQPRGAFTADEVDQSWVQVVNIDRRYAADVWPCYGITKGVDLANAGDYPLFAYTEDSDADSTAVGDKFIVRTRPPDFFSLPDDAYDLDVASTKAILAFNPKSTSGNPDDITVCRTLPMKSIRSCTLPKLNGVWGESSYYDYVSPSVYVYQALPVVKTVLLQPTGIDYGPPVYSGDADDAIDRDRSTGHSIWFRAGAAGTTSTPQANVVLLAWEFQFPDPPDKFFFDRVYFGIDATLTPGNTIDYPNRTRLFVKWKHWVGVAETAIELDKNPEAYGINTVYWDLPDRYYITSPNSGNVAFYSETFATGQSWAGSYNYLGYSNYEISDVTSLDEYKQLTDGRGFLGEAMYFDCGGDTMIMECTFTLRELAVIFEKTLSVKDAIYAPLSGRVFNDTWGSRKTATALMEDAGDVLEHICRLQCWDDTSATPTAGWGKGYADGALINTLRFTAPGDIAAGTTITLAAADAARVQPGMALWVKDTAHMERAVVDSVAANEVTLTTALANDYTAARGAVVWVDGCFDADDLYAYPVARQVLDWNDGYTDELKRTLCESAMLVSYVDAFGYECVRKLTKNVPAATEAITLADITDRTKIAVAEIDPEDVYAEPFVQCSWNYATDKPQHAIRIRNTSAATYSSAYVEGLGAGAAETYWTRCQTLWQRVRQIVEVPKSWSDLLWINGEGCESTAERVFAEKIDWSFYPEINFPLHYTKAYWWVEGHTFTLTLAHHTGGATYTCIVRKIVVDPNPPFEVMITAVMLRETVGTDYFVQDTMTQYGTDKDWVDTTTEYGNDYDKIDKT